MPNPKENSILNLIDNTPIEKPGSSNLKPLTLENGNGLFY